MYATKIYILFRESEKKAETPRTPENNGALHDGISYLFIFYYCYYFIVTSTTTVCYYVVAAIMITITSTDTSQSI